jgi:hypothetical protein
MLLNVVRAIIGRLFATSEATIVSMPNPSPATRQQEDSKWVAT